MAIAIFAAAGSPAGETPPATPSTYLPFQDESVAARFPEIPREDFEQAVHLILPDGSVCSGAEAVFRSLAEAGKERWLLWLYQKFPGFAELTEMLYEEVAHAPRISFQAGPDLFRRRDRRRSVMSGCGSCFCAGWP